MNIYNSQRQTFTIDTISNDLKFIFDGVYRMSRKGALFKKYKVLNITLNPNRESQIVRLLIEGCHWNKPKSPKHGKGIFVNFSLEGGKLKGVSPFYFVNLPEWTYEVGEGIISGDYNLNTYSQFWVEYENIKNKHPEYFL